MKPELITLVNEQRAALAVPPLSREGAVLVLCVGLVPRSDPPELRLAYCDGELSREQLRVLLQEAAAAVGRGDVERVVPE